MFNGRNSLPTSEQSDQSFEQYMGKSALVGSDESTSASWALAWKDSAVGLISRSMAIDELEAGGATPLTPEEANKQYPGMTEPFREPVNPYVARLKYDTQVEKQDLERKIQEGPQDSWTKTKVFGAGMLAHMADPLEFAAGAIVGWGIGGVAARGTFGATAQAAAQATRAGTGTFAQALAFDAIEGAGGALIENVAQEGAQKLVEYKEGVVDPRTNYEIGTDILYGSIAAFGLQAAPKSFARGINFGMEGMKRFLRNTSPEADLTIARNIVHAAETGTVPDSSHIMKAIAQETNIPHERVGYDYSPLIGSPEGKKFYSADTVNGSTKLGDDYGFGVHITDNPGVANAAAARGFAEGSGTVREVSIDSLNPLDLDAPLHPDLELLTNDLLETAGMASADIKRLSGVPAKEKMAYINNAVDAGLLYDVDQALIKSKMQDLGYDSMISNGKSFNGIRHQPHNHITILDEGKIKQVGEFSPNKEGVNSPSEKDMAEATAQAKSPKRIFQNDDHEAMVARVEQELESVRSIDIRKQIDTDVEELDILKQQGFITDVEMKAIKESLVEVDDAHTLLKHFAACVRK